VLRAHQRRQAIDVMRSDLLVELQQRDQLSIQVRLGLVGTIGEYSE